MFDWDDLRVFLAVARAGSTLAAARRLGIGQSTAARRVAALERALGQVLFERRQDGYRLTGPGQALLPAAERMEEAAGLVADGASALLRGLQGVVRVTTIDLAASHFLLPELPEFHRAFPGIGVELLTTEERLDILRGEADVGIRFGGRPAEAALVVSALGQVRMALYASEDYAQAHGVPATPAQLDAGHTIIRGTGYIDTRPENGWLAAAAPAVRIAHRSSTGAGILQAVRAGVGIGWLPTVVGDAEAGLRQLFPPPPELAAGVWLVTSDSLRRLPHIRAFIDFVTPRLRRRLAAR